MPLGDHCTYPRPIGSGAQTLRNITRVHFSLSIIPLSVGLLVSILALHHTNHAYIYMLISIYL